MEMVASAAPVVVAVRSVSTRVSFSITIVRSFSVVLAVIEASKPVVLMLRGLPVVPIVPSVAVSTISPPVMSSTSRALSAIVPEPPVPAISSTRPSPASIRLSVMSVSAVSTTSSSVVLTLREVSPILPASAVMFRSPSTPGVLAVRTSKVFSSRMKASSETPLMMRLSTSISSARSVNPLPIVVASSIVRVGVTISPPARSLVSRIAPPADNVTVEPRSVAALTSSLNTMSPPVVNAIEVAAPAPTVIAALTRISPVMEVRLTLSASPVVIAPVTVIVSSALMVRALISTFALMISNSLSLSKVV